MIKKAKHHFSLMSVEVQGALWMFMACFWFSIMGVVVRYMTENFDLNPLMLVFFRNFFSVLILLPWAFQYGLPKIRTNYWRLYISRGVIGNVGMVALFYALAIIPLTEVVALTFTTPLVTTLLAMAIFKEKVGYHRWIALLMGFVGVLVILRPGAGAIQYASLIVLITAISWSASNIMIKKLTKTDHSRVIVFIMVFIMTILSFPIALIDWKTPDFEELVWLAFLAFVANLAQLCMANAYSKTDVSIVMPVDFSRLVITSILAYFIFAEILSVWTAIGSVIIFASSVYVVKREKIMAKNTNKK